jgi:hypothetical protein
MRETWKTEGLTGLWRDPFMQDAHVRRWARQPQVPAEMLESVRELNHRFLDLVAMQPTDWNSSRRVGLPVEVSAQIAPLSAAQKKAAADCPYALFDLRFHDDDYWQTRLRTAGPWIVADEATVDESTRNFVQLALFFAWHVASVRTLAPCLLLGMNEVTAAAFRGTTIGCLPALAATEAVNLTARWHNCPTYWSALTGAASRPNSVELRRVQLYGLQLAAAARLA